MSPRPESLRATLLRNGLIAVGVASVVVLSTRRWSQGPAFALLALWPSFGGHLVEIFFLRVAQPRLPAGRPIAIATRLVTWFIGGSLLFAAIRCTAPLLGVNLRHWPAWWRGGLGFIALELLVHLGLQLRGRPSFYNGRA